MGSIGASRTKAKICLASVCQPTPKHNTTHTWLGEAGETESRKIVMNSFILESLRNPIVKKPVYQLNLFTLKEDLFFSWTY